MTRSVRTGFLWLAALVATASLPGCNYFILLGYLIGGPPAIEPEFEKETGGKSLTDLDVTVAVVCFAPTEVKFNFDEIDHEIAKYVTFQLHAHKIKVISPDRVRAWLDKNPEWDKAEEIGEAFGVTYVIYVDLNEFSLYEENSTQLYRGRSSGWVSVFEMDKDGNGDKIFSKEFNDRYPKFAPRETSEVSYATFKKEYLSHISEEIGVKFYEQYQVDRIGRAL
jgi:hypothetical protein